MGSEQLQRALLRHRVYVVLGAFSVLSFSSALLALVWLVEPFPVGVKDHHGGFWFLAWRDEPVWPVIVIALSAALGTGSLVARRVWRQKYPAVADVDQALR